ncbi:hypothetical protein [Caldicellulosiruptor changbaiensis]|nr:hypothetical protein [Caldicellulosiruptor changbaiensis]
MVFVISLIKKGTVFLTNEGSSFLFILQNIVVDVILKNIDIFTFVE